MYHDPANDGVFAADAAGINTPDTDGPVETTPPSNFDLAGALQDVETLQELDPAAIYYGHFGDVETADNLERYADVLAAWVADVEAVWEEIRDEAAVVEHFQERADAADYWNDRKAMAETSLNVRGVLHYLRGREDD